MTLLQTAAPSAFRDVRARYFIFLWLLPFFPGVGTLLDNVGTAWPWYWWDIAWHWLHHGLFATLLVVFGVAAWKLPLRACLGTEPTRAEIVDGIWLTAFVYLASLSTLYATFYPLSLVAPEFVQYWLIDLPPVIYFEENTYQRLPSALSVLSLCVVGPALEEMTFRGLILPRWTLKWGPRWGIFGSSAAFAIVHTDPAGALLFGVAMCVLYFRTQSLLLPILCHGLYNSAVWLEECAYIAANGPDHVYTLEHFREEWRWGVIAAVVAAGMLAVYLRRSRNDVRWALPIT